MLGFGALAQFALAQAFQMGGQSGHAWRRILAYTRPQAVLNRDVPGYLAYYDSDEEEAVIAILKEL